MDTREAITSDVIETDRRRGRLPLAHDKGAAAEDGACLPRPFLGAITREVMDWTSARDYFAGHANHPQNRWRLPARMAPQAPNDSVRTRQRGRDLGTASQLPRDRPLAGLARNAAASVRAARHSLARAQCHSAGGGLCAGLRGKAPCIARNGCGAAGGRARAEGTRAVSRA